MSGNATETQSEEHKQLTETLDCGHSAARETTRIRETLDEVCVSCRTPMRLSKWDDVLRETTVHHRTGESTTYRTWLVGIDMRGRAIYYDEKNTRMLRVVPREDYRFKQFRDGDEEPLRKYSTRGPAPARLLNAPDGSDHLVSVDTDSVDPTEITRTAVVNWLVTDCVNCPYGVWDSLSEVAIGYLEHVVEQYGDSDYNPLDVPFELAELVLGYAKGEQQAECPAKPRLRYGRRFRKEIFTSAVEDYLAATTGEDELE